MKLSSALNPNVVKTALDKVFYPEFDKKEKMGHVNAESGLVFNQMTSSKSAEIEEVFAGSGYWGETNESENYSESAPSVEDTKTTVHSKFTQAVRVTEEFVEDDQHNVIRKMVRDMAATGRKTRDKNAMGLYRGAFTTSLVASGDAVVSDSHTTRSGDTVDNKLTAVFGETSLDSAITALYEMKDEDGTLAGTMAETLFVPAALYKEAAIVLDSRLRSGTADNDANIYSTRYDIGMAVSRWIGAAAGGSDTAWFLIGDTHGLNRYVRIPMQTEVVPGMYQSNGDTIYKGRFRESVSATHYIGLVGSDGSV